MSHYFEHLLQEYGYGLVFVTIMLEAMGVPLPGESMLIGAAIYAGTTHNLSIWWLVPTAIVGAIVGDNLGYLIGRWIGRRLIVRYGTKIGLTEERMQLGDYLFKRYGGVVVFVGRFVAILRTFVAVLAGANHMEWKRFLFWNALGGIVWAGGYTIAAYWLGKAFMQVSGPLGIGLGVAGAIAAVGAFVFLKRNEKRLIEEAKQEMRKGGDRRTQPAAA